MAKIQYHPTETQLVELVKIRLDSAKLHYKQKYSHKLKNFTDRRNHKFWAIYGAKDSDDVLIKFVEELNKEIETITKDYKAFLYIQKDWEPTWIKIRYLHKK